LPGKCKRESLSEHALSFTLAVIFMITINRVPLEIVCICS